MKYVACVALIAGGVILGAFSLPGGGSDTEIDPEVIAAFDKHPTERQDLILTVALVGEPPLLEPGLPTNDEYNKCTEAYNAWEMLVEQKEAGGG